MHSRRSSVVRFATSALLATAVTLGAHAFVPAAFGCDGTTGGGNCRPGVSQPSPVEAFLAQVDVLVATFDFVLP